MRLTQFTDYALRVLLYLAQHPQRLCTIAEISRVHNISAAHLSKVVHGLGQHGWVVTLRGKQGGLRLAKPPQHIVLGQVVRHTEPDFALAECLRANNACRLSGQCGLAAVLQSATQAFLAQLDGVTLAQVSAATAMPPQVLELSRHRPS